MDNPEFDPTPVTPEWLDSILQPDGLSQQFKLLRGPLGRFAWSHDATKEQEFLVMCNDTAYLWQYASRGDFLTLLRAFGFRTNDQGKYHGSKPGVGDRPLPSQSGKPADAHARSVGKLS